MIFCSLIVVMSCNTGGRPPINIPAIDSLAVKGTPELKIKSDDERLEFIIKSMTSPDRKDYIVETDSGVPDTSKYARDREVDKGLITLTSTNKRVHSFKIDRKKILAVVTLKYDMTVYDKYDVVFAKDSIYFIHTFTTNAGIFTCSDVAIFENLRDELEYFALFNRADKPCLNHTDRELFYTALLYCKKFNISVR